MASGWVTSVALSLDNACVYLSDLRVTLGRDPEFTLSWLTPGKTAGSQEALVLLSCFSVLGFPLNPYREEHKTLRTPGKSSLFL